MIEKIRNFAAAFLLAIGVTTAAVGIVDILVPEECVIHDSEVIREPTGSADSNSRTENKLDKTCSDNIEGDGPETLKTAMVAIASIATMSLALKSSSPQPERSSSGNRARARPSRRKIEEVSESDERESATDADRDGV